MVPRGTFNNKPEKIIVDNKTHLIFLRLNETL